MDQSIYCGLHTDIKIYVIIKMRAKLELYEHIHEDELTTAGDERMHLVIFYGLDSDS